MAASLYRSGKGLWIYSTTEGTIRTDQFYPVDGYGWVSDTFEKGAQRLFAVLPFQNENPTFSVDNLFFILRNIYYREENSCEEPEQ